MSALMEVLILPAFAAMMALSIYKLFQELKTPLVILSL